MVLEVPDPVSFSWPLTFVWHFTEQATSRNYLFLDCCQHPLVILTVSLLIFFPTFFINVGILHCCISFSKTHSLMSSVDNNNMFHHIY